MLDGSIDGVVAALEVWHSDVEGGRSAISLVPGAMLEWGAGNLDLDPLFLDPDLSDGDWRQAPAAPCIDALDLEGSPHRVDDPTRTDTGVGPKPLIDQGAYERGG